MNILIIHLIYTSHQDKNLTKIFYFFRHIAQISLFLLTFLCLNAVYKLYGDIFIRILLTKYTFGDILSPWFV